VGLTQILNLDLGVAIVINDFEGPRLHILLDRRVVEAAADKAPGSRRSAGCRSHSRGIEWTYLTSKMVLAGFMAAWFLAASPINRSFSVNETNDGVVKLPCSLAMISTLVPS